MTAGSTGYALSTFIPVLATSEDLFWVVELDAHTYVAGSGSQYGAACQVLDDQRNVVLTQTNGATNTLGWKLAPTAFYANVVGAGKFAVTAFDRVFVRSAWKPAADQDDLMMAWSANVGTGKDGGSASAKHADFTASGGLRCFLQCDPNAAGGFTVREFHVLKVG